MAYLFSNPVFFKCHKKLPLHIKGCLRCMSFERLFIYFGILRAIGCKICHIFT